MSSDQSPVTLGVVAGWAGWAVVLVQNLLPRVLSLLFERTLFGRQEPKEGLGTIRALDEVCERGVLIREGELLTILNITKKKLEHCRKEGDPIRPGYTIRESNDGKDYWFVKRAQSET